MLKFIKEKKGIVWVVFVVYATVFMSSLIQTPPKGVMSLQIADHYSISLNFLNNGFNFFKPETYTLNVEFPPENQPYREKYSVVPHQAKGITAIDFPIVHYTVALLFKLFNSDSFTIVRLFCLFISFFGLFYLYKASCLITGSYKFSFFLMISILSLPIYINFASSGLPSLYACALLFISFYLYTKYYLEKTTKYYIGFIVLLTLTSLIRFPFLIYLLGLLFSYLLAMVLGIKLKDIGLKIIVTLLSIGVLIGYFLYNQLYLSYYYGTIMLSNPKPLESFEDALYVVKNILIHQTWRYATLLHYILFFVLVYSLFKNISYFKKIKQIHYPVIYLAISSVGVVLYSVLMFKQFKIHTYYLFDTFLPILVFWSILVYKKIELSRLKILRNNYWLYVTLVLLLFGLGKIHYDFGYKRILNNTKSVYETSIMNFEGSKIIFDDLGIAKSAKILFMDDYTNMIFNQYKRKSYVVFRPTYKKIQEALTWDYDYILTQNFSFKEKILANYPSFNKETEVFYSNDKFTIHLKK